MYNGHGRGLYNRRAGYEFRPRLLSLLSHKCPCRKALIQKRTNPQKTPLLAFPRNHANSRIIMKQTLQRAMIAYILEKYAIKKKTPVIVLKFNKTFEVAKF